MCMSSLNMQMSRRLADTAKRESEVEEEVTNVENSRHEAREILRFKVVAIIVEVN